MKGQIGSLCIAAALFCSLFVSCGRSAHELYGHWKFVAAKSASIDPWTDLALDISSDGTHVTIVKRYSAGHLHDRRIDSMTVNTEGNEEIVSIPPGRWLGQVSMGIYYGPAAQRHVTARMGDPGKKMHITSRETLETAQGETLVEVKETYVLSPDGSAVQVTEERSTRQFGPPLIYTFARNTQ